MDGIRLKAGSEQRIIHAPVRPEIAPSPGPGEVQVDHAPEIRAFRDRTLRLEASAAQLGRDPPVAREASAPQAVHDVGREHAIVEVAELAQARDRSVRVPFRVPPGCQARA